MPKTVTRQRRECDLNPGPSAPESLQHANHSATIINRFTAQIVRTGRRRFGDEAGETTAVVTALATAEARTVGVRPTRDVSRRRHGRTRRRRPATAAAAGSRTSRIVVDVVVLRSGSVARRRLLVLATATRKRRVGLHPCCVGAVLSSSGSNNKLATVLVATGRMAAAAQIDSSSYSPGDVV